MPHFPTVSMKRFFSHRIHILAFNHFKTIREDKILHFDLGTWFGAHFDYDLLKYVIDKTGQPLESEGSGITNSICSSSSFFSPRPVLRSL